MSYTLLRGTFVIRYPDLPRRGPEPDGDTVKFRPDNPALVERLARHSGRPPGINRRGVSVRLEAIDALETHFAETHQEPAGALAARDELLRLLGFTNVTFWDDLPNTVRSADQDELRGHVLSNGIDANGRLIAFAYAGDHPGPDGSAVFLDGPLADGSVNAALLSAGLVYPAFYATLPAELRTHLAEVSAQARRKALPSGIWPRSTGDPNGPATIAGLTAAEQLVMWPKLFRRIVPYLAEGFTDFSHFDAWLRADPVHRDDQLFLLDKLERGNLHDVVRASGQQVQLTVWPERFVIDPDPAPPGAPVRPPLIAAGDLLIVAALPDPAGADRGAESVTLLNLTPDAVDLSGWSLSDTGGGRLALSGSIAGGATLRVTPGAALRLGNQGDGLVLVDEAGTTIDQVTYKADQVRAGRTICFGR
ncbi:lamin tail domain-containing protein [Actinomadura sp. ATCC 31491]|uniref:Lamin tail domain-containing protein n=1 Tax=Actinomadura luzonensis TaxID=2805427 RepID=A0ABT0G6F8_9ACTN|nr:lamin tail domain-containing protein [Actinomadura luzonensis]MCK2220094.1 lamin tail domain-containing protein [Actinomadura luzonensis]